MTSPWALMSVRRLVGWSVGWSVCLNFLRGWEYTLKCSYLSSCSCSHERSKYRIFMRTKWNCHFVSVGDDLIPEVATINNLILKSLAGTAKSPKTREALYATMAVYVGTLGACTGTSKKPAYSQVHYIYCRGSTTIATTFYFRYLLYSRLKPLFFPLCSQWN